MISVWHQVTCNSCYVVGVAVKLLLSSSCESSHYTMQDASCICDSCMKDQGLAPDICVKDQGLAPDICMKNQDLACGNDMEDQYLVCGTCTSKDHDLAHE